MFRENHLPLWPVCSLTFRLVVAVPVVAGGVPGAVAAAQQPVRVAGAAGRHVRGALAALPRAGLAALPHGRLRPLAGAAGPGTVTLLPPGFSDVSSTYNWE